ncbi:MAG: GntR family transcriptional regulator [Deltaproteobacteria bacterium]|nr:GntR family transcriptional regulator [Deltaproteobacteria bacterium]
MLLPKIKNKLSLSDHAYMVIKEAILNNTFKPRDILLEESVAEMLGISRTPLRMALKRLEFEKLVFTNSSKQAVVAEIDLEDMTRVFVFRLAVEPVIARMTSILVTKQSLDDIEDCLVRNAKAIETKNLVDIVTCELEFDELLAVCADNEFLTDSVVMIHGYLQRFLTLSTTSLSDAPASLTEHRIIFDALLSNNSELAMERTTFHVRQVAKRLGFSLPI